VKNESAYTKKFAALLKKVKEAHQPAEPASTDPVTQLVVAYLQWNSSRKLATAAHEKLMKQMVDNNDLRVSHPHEIVNIIGEDYPRAHERAARMLEALQEIFVREHVVSIDGILAQGKKQAKAYLESLPGMVSYVSARVMLLSAGAHVIPVDDLLRDKLVAEEVVDPDATIEEVAAFIERQIKAGEALATHLALEEWSTVGGVRRTAPKPAPAAKPAAPAAKAVEARPAPAARPAEAKAAKPAAKKTETKSNAKPAPKTTKKTTKKSTKSRR
jgi:endonuclease III